MRSFDEIRGAGLVFPRFPTFRGFMPDYAVDGRGQVAFRARQARLDDARLVLLRTR